MIISHNAFQKVMLISHNASEKITISHNAIQQTFSFPIKCSSKVIILNKLGKPSKSTSLLYEVPVYATFDIFSKIFFLLL